MLKKVILAVSLALAVTPVLAKSHRPAPLYKE